MAFSEQGGRGRILKFMIISLQILTTAQINVLLKNSLSQHNFVCVCFAFVRRFIKLCRLLLQKKYAPTDFIINSRGKNIFHIYVFLFVDVVCPIDKFLYL